MSHSSRSIVVAGGTGLVGREVIALLAQREGLHVRALVRKAGSIAAATGEKANGTTVEEVVFDYDDGKSYGALFEAPAPETDVVFSCLGTTRAKAGSDEAFRRVDLVYPQRLLDAFAVHGSKGTFALVSSVGADGKTGLYLRTKHELEQAVFATGLRYAIVRPSLLEGDRGEARLGEKIGSVLMKPLSALGKDLLGLKAAYKYAPIHVHDVAQALVRAALDGGKESVLLEGKGLFAAAKLRGAATFRGGRHGHFGLAEVLSKTMAGHDTKSGVTVAGTVGGAPVWKMVHLPVMLSPSTAPAGAQSVAAPLFLPANVPVGST
jgi:uncharacterized protein YbjT (DUF2867 family)